MPTRLDIRNVVADMLSRTDLPVQIDREIERAVRYLRSENLDLSEIRGMTLTLVNGQVYYDTVSGATGESLATVPADIPVPDILSVQYAREGEDGANLRNVMEQIPYHRFEYMREGSRPTGEPYFFTLYGGQIGFFPGPAGGEEIFLSGVVRPQVPETDAATSVYFDETPELVEMLTAAQVSHKYEQDDQRASGFSRRAASLLGMAKRVSSSRRSTGRIRDTLSGFNF